MPLRHDQERPAGFQRQIADLDPPRVVEHRRAPIRARDDQIGGAGFLGDIGSQRRIGDAGSPFQLLYPALQGLAKLGFGGGDFPSDFGAVGNHHFAGGVALIVSASGRADRPRYR